MSRLVLEQIFGFVIMFFCGSGIAMFRQFFKWYQSDYKPVKVIILIQEMLFWLMASLITSAFLYYAGYGAVTFHGVIGFTLGVLLWYNIWRYNSK